ncbi:Hypothetical protein CAP_1736 [Chondromyces apiculatus DSM 436]|uniref:Uncharacterized protein n=1 Tax=Chondromyces apiculatus DSM 436 TaxID=1192034 RepID=A0A017TDF0_9BACT|nr:Hypothetical protein CAP_1736 [Chondromyces apiculatus DSM 436]
MLVGLGAPAAAVARVALEHTVAVVQEQAAPCRVSLSPSLKDRQLRKASFSME